MKCPFFFFHWNAFFSQSAIVTWGYFTPHLIWAKRAWKLTFNTGNRERKEESIVVCEVLGLCIFGQWFQATKLQEEAFFEEEDGGETGQAGDNGVTEGRYMLLWGALKAIASLMLCGQHLSSPSLSFFPGPVFLLPRPPPLLVFVSDFPRKGQHGGHGVKNPAFLTDSLGKWSKGLFSVHSQHNPTPLAPSGYMEIIGFACNTSFMSLNII